MIQTIQKHSLRLKFIVASALLLFAMVSLTQTTHAAALGQVFVRFDRLQTSTATTGTVCAAPTTVASTEGKVVVTFPTGYTLGVASTFTVNTTNLAWPAPSGYTVAAWPSITTATTVAGQAVTFTSGDLTSATTLYCFNWTNSAAVTTSASATASNLGTVATQTSAAAAIDSAQFTTATITNDQIQVTATVPTAFSFALSGNTDPLGTLSTSTVTSSPTPRTVTVNTNAKNGWMVWAKDSNTGLTSASAGATIGSTTPGTVSTLSAGTEGYNTGVTGAQTSGAGTITLATPFASAGVAGKGGGLNTSLAALASSNGTANNAVLTLTNNVAIGATTAAATDYTDTITVVGAGLF